MVEAVAAVQSIRMNNPFHTSTPDAFRIVHITTGQIVML